MEFLELEDFNQIDYQDFIQLTLNKLENVKNIYNYL